MNADLVRAPSLGKRADDRKALTVCVLKPSLDTELRPGRRAVAMNHLLQPDRGRHLRSLPQERRVDRRLFPIRPTPDDGEILLRNSLFLHRQTKMSSRGGVLRDKHQTARLAIEPVNDRNLPAVGNLEREQLL